MRTLRHIYASNFLSLKKAEVELQDLNVLVGPNGAGKTNLLTVIRFLGAVARLDLIPALDMFGGFRRLAFAGNPGARIEVGIEAVITSYASESAPDRYKLSFSQGRMHHRGAQERDFRIAARREVFSFKRTQGRGRRITVTGDRVDVQETEATGRGSATTSRRSRGQPSQETFLRDQSAALSTLRRLRSDISDPIDQMARFFEEFVVYDINVDAARRPSPIASSTYLSPSAENLSAFLYSLKEKHPEIFDAITDDLIAIMPTVTSIGFEAVGGGTEAVILKLQERPFKEAMPLEVASFGTVRALALLALLHNPKPPRTICVEEVDHGLHPFALDRIVDRMRGAMSRTQLIVATHSPALVNRLEPEELIVCERNLKDGASLIPAIDSTEVRKMEEASNLELGELWFTGALSHQNGAAYE